MSVDQLSHLLEGDLDSVWVGHMKCQWLGWPLVLHWVPAAGQCLELLWVKPHLAQVLGGSIGCMIHWNGQN